MKILEVCNLTFTYPGSERPALSNVCFAAERGEFVILSGKTGCGKTTLLRCLKHEVRPFGSFYGTVILSGEESDTMDERKRIEKIGYVIQEAESQIVTDSVWHELSFGLESLGVSQKEMKKRVGEISNFFGIQSWFRKKTSDLSGGQKQILNLASAMVMRPDILLLDEPCSQLDPVASEEFCNMIRKINRELGTTILISEHIVDSIIGMADRIIYLDRGKIISDKSPRKFLTENTTGLPAVSRIYFDWYMSHPEKTKDFPAPLDVEEARRWFCTFSEDEKKEFLRGVKEKKCGGSAETVLRAKNLYFSYNGRDEYVIRDLCLSVNKGEIFAVLGGNGSGKSTMLKLLNGLICPQRGKIKRDGNSVMMFQDPQVLFSEMTVRDELRKVRKREPDDIISLTGIGNILECHPYDISGGEQHKVALSMVLMADPDILFLDEPTRGLDPETKDRLREILYALKAEGKTVVLVSHDIEFCAVTADRCTMLFDGELTEPERTSDFFRNNMFYTTAFERMIR